jgi:hypothetical protein
LRRYECLEDGEGTSSKETSAIETHVGVDRFLCHLGIALHGFRNLVLSLSRLGGLSRSSVYIRDPAVCTVNVDGRMLCSTFWDWIINKPVKPADGARQSQHLVHT